MLQTTPPDVTTRHLIEVADRAQWDAFIDTSPFGHPFQLWGWGELKRAGNWTPHRLALVHGDEWLGGAQVLHWPIPRLGRGIAYVPRGPVVDPACDHMPILLERLVAWCRARKALYLRVEPAWTAAERPPGWTVSKQALQMSETYTIDLSRPNDSLLEPMSRKHRQYIRKSERDGVTVSLASGTEAERQAMYALYAETAQRARFGIHAADYYARLQNELGANNHLYFATAHGEPIAFLWLASGGRTAYELYGGVNELGQRLKANYLLKWRAITSMKARGCLLYDFNGRFNEGIARFKEGFGPTAVDWVGTWDHPISSLGYHGWERLWPMAAPLVRRLLGGGSGVDGKRAPGQQWSRSPE
jgi:lipid II:glycine glycyltransferase (peptidoglycan interpeptide bridge formation enzyme)